MAWAFGKAFGCHDTISALAQGFAFLQAAELWLVDRAAAIGHALLFVREGTTIDALIVAYGRIADGDNGESK
jgi:hypothetical protein